MIAIFLANGGAKRNHGRIRRKRKTKAVPNITDYLVFHYASRFN